MHIPVLQKEVLQHLDPKKNENFIDCTFGGGGHALTVLEKISPKGKVLGIEVDSEIYRKIKPQTKKFLNRLILVNDSYVNLKKIVEKYSFGPIHGILFDLGMSSWHLEESERGFSFMRTEPLDMRYGLQKSLTAEKIINFWAEEEIEKILREYGQERFSRTIAKEIIKARKRSQIKTTLQLVGIIKEAIPRKCQHQKIHPATRTFQALRITVNDELENFRRALPQALEILEKEGRIVVISFHSLEDKIVKTFFKERAKEDILKILTKKPIIPSKTEIQKNPRSRSAKLRAAIKGV